MNERASPEPRRTWLRNAGLFLAWAGGLAGGAAVLVAIVLLIGDLFVADRLFALRHFSNGMFFAFVALMIGGLIAPLAGERFRAEQDGAGIWRSLPNKKEEDAPEARHVSGQPVPNKGRNPLRLSDKEMDRVRRVARKRIARVYNPWPWRLWTASLLAFGIAILSGL